MKYIRIILSSLLVIVGSLLFVNFASSFFFKSSLFNAYIVQSGSMEPAVKTGSLVISLPSQTYSQNDVITYKDGKKLVTHRIEVKLFPEGAYSDPIYMTSGDANKGLDRIKLSQDQIVGKVLFSVPYLGYVADFAKTPQGFILFVVIPATIIVYEELKFLFNSIISRIREKIKKNGLNNNTSIGINTKLIAFIPIFGAIIVFVGLTNSFFLDSEISSQNVFQAAVFSTPSPTPTPTPTSTPTPTPTPVGIAIHVVISEVQITAGPGVTDHDFVEFYNPTSSPFDLNGHRLVKRTGSSSTDDTIKSWISSAVIPAHGFYLWASSDDGYGTSIGADTSTTENIAASNSIALRFGAENTGTIIDALSWNSGANSLKEGTEFSPDPGANQSMERKALSTSTASTMAVAGVDEFKGNGFDLNNNSTDFILRTVSQPQNSSSASESP